MRLVTSTKVISTNASAQACSCNASSGASEYWKIVSGIELTEWLGFQSVSCPASAHVKSKGAVSPAARAIASVVPVRMPPKDVGTTTRKTVCHFETPSAKLASRSSFGTSASTSIVARATSGSMMIASAKPPANALWWCPQPTIGTSVFTISVKTKMPITIDGKPFRTSSQSLICSPSRRGANSLTKIAVRTPNGSASTVAMPTSSMLPTSAGATPPPAAEERRALREEVDVERVHPAREHRPDEDPEHDDGDERRGERDDLGDLLTTRRRLPRPVARSEICGSISRRPPAGDRSA